jgi:hypothetical protein
VSELKLIPSLAPSLSYLVRKSWGPKHEGTKRGLAEHLALFLSSWTLTQDACCLKAVASVLRAGQRVTMVEVWAGEASVGLCIGGGHSCVGTWGKRKATSECVYMCAEVSGHIRTCPEKVLLCVLSALACVCWAISVCTSCVSLCQTGFWTR